RARRMGPRRRGGCGDRAWFYKSRKGCAEAMEIAVVMRQIWVAAKRGDAEVAERGAEIRWSEKPKNPPLLMGRRVFLRVRVSLAAASDGGEDVVEVGGRAEGGGGLGDVGLVVAAGVGGCALDGDEFFHDLRFVGGELFRDGSDDGFQLGVIALGGEFSGP